MWILTLDPYTYTLELTEEKMTRQNSYLIIFLNPLRFSLQRIKLLMLYSTLATDYFCDCNFQISLWENVKKSSVMTYLLMNNQTHTSQQQSWLDQQSANNMFCIKTLLSKSTLLFQIEHNTQNLTNPNLFFDPSLTSQSTRNVTVSSMSFKTRSESSRGDISTKIKPAGLIKSKNPQGRQRERYRPTHKGDTCMTYRGIKCQKVLHVAAVWPIYVYGSPSYCKAWLKIEIILQLLILLSYTPHILYFLILFLAALNQQT